MTMADYRGMFDRDYLGAWDLTPGRDFVVTISKVAAETLTGTGGRKTKKPVVWFEGKQKGLALNKTNAKAIAGMYGNDTDKWIGRNVAIFATQTEMAGETVDCIRVRPTIPIARKAASDESA